MSDQLTRAVQIASATVGISGQDFIVAAVNTAVISMASHDPHFAAMLKSQNVLPEIKIAA